MKQRTAGILCCFLLSSAMLCAGAPKACASYVYPTEGYVAENILLVGQEMSRLTDEENVKMRDASPSTVALPLEKVINTDRMPSLAFVADRFYLFLDKASCQLTIYFADKDGSRSDFVLCNITVAIGKRSTPTPSGIFTLSTKERWHYFGPSYAPYVVEFMPGRYLHGPLYSSASDTAVKVEHLSDFGKMVTGGCIRIPVNDARWIYENCQPGTYLEIVNGV